MYSFFYRFSRNNVLAVHPVKIFGIDLFFNAVKFLVDCVFPLFDCHARHYSVFDIKIRKIGNRYGQQAVLIMNEKYFFQVFCRSQFPDELCQDIGI